jgi:hypothetical protein
MRPTVYPETIALIVEEYGADRRLRAAEDAWWRADGLPFEAVLDRVGRAEVLGKRHGHQRRLPAARAGARCTPSTIACARRPISCNSGFSFKPPLRRSGAWASWRSTTPPNDCDTGSSWSPAMSSIGTPAPGLARAGWLAAGCRRRAPGASCARRFRPASSTCPRTRSKTSFASTRTSFFSAPSNSAQDGQAPVRGAAERPTFGPSARRPTATVVGTLQTGTDGR